MAAEQKERYEARLDSFSLEMETIDDAIEKAIARHEFPYRDGALLEDMGQRARIIRIRCYWYEETYETHKEFVKHLARRERFELLHPKYGLLKGSVESVAIRHDDRLRTAEVDLSFVEGLIDSAEPERRPDVLKSTESGFVMGQAELVTEINQDIVNLLGTEGNDIAAAEIDPTELIAYQIKGLTQRGRDYIKAVDAYVAELGGTLNTVGNPVGSLLDLIQYPSTVGGHLAGSLARTLERYTVLYDSLRSAPRRYLSQLRNGLGALGLTHPHFTKHTQIAAVQRRSLETAALYQDDESLREQLKQRETAQSFDALGRYIGTESPWEPIMTIDDIEATLAEIRTDIQTAVSSARGMTSLKTMAETLLEYVSQVKLERDKIITVETPGEMPLHLICLRYGLPYAYAERIYSINAIKHPSFIPPGEVRIYAR